MECRVPDGLMDLVAVPVAFLEFPKVYHEVVRYPLIWPKTVQTGNVRVLHCENKILIPTCGRNGLVNDDNAAVGACLQEQHLFSWSDVPA